MDEVALKVKPKTALGIIFVILGVAIILIMVLQAYAGLEDVTMFGEIEQVLGWFFGLVIATLGGFFIAYIGAKVMRK